MEEILKEVLIKECGNMLHDKVFIVENLPKKFLYEKTVKMVQRVTENGFRDGTMVPDPNGELVETLHVGIEKSQSGDGGYLFWTTERESKQRLADIDNYIERTVSRDTRITKRVPYAQSVGDPSSPAMAYHLIPRMRLPIIETLRPQATEPTPQESPSQAQAQAAPSQKSGEPEGRSSEPVKRKAGRPKKVAVAA